MFTISRVFGSFEIGLLLGINALIFVYRPGIIPIESDYDYIAVIVPFAVSLVIGLLAHVQAYRIVLRQAEWGFHLLTSIIAMGLVFSLLFNDRLSPWLPFSWTFFLWMAWFTLLLVDYVVMNLDQTPMMVRVRSVPGRTRLMGLFLVTFAGTCLGMVFLSSPTSVWIVSACFHAIMIPIVQHQAYTDKSALDTRIHLNPKKKGQVLGSTHAFFRTIFLIGTFCLAWYQASFIYNAGGTASDFYAHVIDVVFTIPFWLGIGLALILSRWGLVVFGDLGTLGILLLGLLGTLEWAPFCIAYAFISLLLLSGTRPPHGQAFSLWLLACTWLGGLFLFWDEYDFVRNSGLVNIYLDVLKGTAIIGFVEFGLGLVFLMLLKLIGKKPMPPAKHLSEGNVAGWLPSRARKQKWIVWGFLLLAMASPIPILTASGVKALPDPLPVSPHPVGDFMGNIRGDFHQMNLMGARWIRMDFTWSGIESSQGHWDFTGSDSGVNNSLAHGLKILGILTYGVSWLNGSSGSYVSPADIPYFVDFVNRTVSRYKGQVAAWESWNEPNLSWSGSQQDFFTMLNASINTIRAIDPSIEYVVGDLASAQPDWLDAMFRAGIMTNVRAISFHPYYANPDDFAAFLRQEIAVGKHYDFQGEYWVTEVGNPTGGYATNSVSMHDQAIHVIYTYTLATALNMSKVIYYEYQDNSESDQQKDPWNSENCFGLVYANGTWKPAAYAFQLFSNHCTNSTFRPDLLQRSIFISGNHVIEGLYRRTSGESTLILWYEPVLSVNDTIQVQVDLHALAGSVYQWNIYTDTNQSVPGGDSPFTIALSTTPVFITFNAQALGSPVSLQAEGSPSVILTAIGLPILTCACIWIGLRTRHFSLEENEHQE